MGLTVNVDIPQPSYDVRLAKALKRAPKRFAATNPHTLPRAVRPPGDITSRLRASWATKVEGNGVRIGSFGVPYAIFQEEGTSRGIPANKMLGRQTELFQRGFRKILIDEIKKAGK